VGGNAAINDEFVKIAGLNIAKGCYMTNEPLPADLGTPAAKEFLDAYKAKGVPGITGKIGFTDKGDREGVPMFLYVVDSQGKIVVSK
jgi:branched-chain amino acid transport system substrate-binding protein